MKNLTEKTLVIIKPDGVQRALVGEIISRFERAGLKIIGMKLIHASKDLAGKHYKDDEEWMLNVGRKSKKSYAEKGIELKASEKEIGMRIRKQLMDFISMSPSVAMCIEGHGAIDKVRALVGVTAPMNAMPGTIRGDLAFDSYQLSDESGRPIQNLIHASDSIETAKREIKIWFKDEEILPYQRVDEALLYRQGE
ncbi:nucleoside-diphosphate kinase [Candidatus Woesearchaeota archaeon]|nr:nucleoside-diphosphate kinase [Candidatus Woesearchaeota archaeon]